MQTLQQTTPLAVQPCRALHAGRTLAVRPSVLAVRRQRMERGCVVRTAEEKVVEQGACMQHCGASLDEPHRPLINANTNCNIPQPQQRKQACLVWPFRTPMSNGFQCWHPRTCQKVRGRNSFDFRRSSRHRQCILTGVRKEVRVNGQTLLLFWYRNQIYCTEARSPAEGAYSEGLIKGKFTQDFSIECPTTGTLYSLKDGSIVEWCV